MLEPGGTELRWLEADLLEQLIEVSVGITEVECANKKCLHRDTPYTSNMVLVHVIILVIGARLVGDSMDQWSEMASPSSQQFQ